MDYIPWVDVFKFLVHKDFKNLVQICKSVYQSMKEWIPEFFLTIPFFTKDQNVEFFLKSKNLKGIQYMSRHWCFEINLISIGTSLRLGNEEISIYLMEKRNVDKDYEYVVNTLIFESCRAGFFKVFQILLQHYRFVQDGETKSPLGYILQFKRFEYFYVLKPEHMQIPDEEEFLELGYCNDLNIIQWFLEKCPFRFNGDYLAMVMVFNPTPDIVSDFVCKYLKTTSYLLLATMENGEYSVESYIHSAWKSKNFKSISVFLKLFPNSNSRHHYTLDMIYAKDWHGLNYFLFQGVGVNSVVGMEFLSEFSDAIGNFKIVKLVKRHPILLTTNFSFIKKCFDQKQFKRVEFLLSIWPNSISSDECFSLACMMGNLKLARLLDSNFVSLQVWQSLLDNNQKDILEFLAEKIARGDRIGPAWLENEHILKFLIDNNYVKKSFFSKWSDFWSYKQIISNLLKNGIPANDFTINYSIHCDNLENLECMLNYGCPIQKFLYLACVVNQNLVVEFLLQKGACPQKNNFCAYQLAKAYNSEKVLTCLESFYTKNKITGWK